MVTSRRKPMRRQRCCSYPFANDVALLSAAWNSLKNIVGLAIVNSVSHENQCRLSRKTIAYFCCSSQEEAGSSDAEPVCHCLSYVCIHIRPQGKYLFLNGGAAVGSSQARGIPSLSGVIFNNEFFQHLGRDGWTRKFLKFANVRAGYFFFCEVASKSIGWEAKISGHSLYSGSFRTLCIVALSGHCPALHSSFSLAVN